MMMYTILALFMISACLGLLILIRWLADKRASRAVIFSHGAFAALALVLLILFAMQQKDRFPGISITLFVFSAAIGFYMFVRDMNYKKNPLTVAFIHALLAAGGIAALLLFLLL